MDSLIRKAITEKRLIEFDYNGCHRIAEPHVYGVDKGVTQLLIFQVRGQSMTGGMAHWRRVDLKGVTNLVLLDERFPGKRFSANPEHSQWDRCFAVVE